MARDREAHAAQRPHPGGDGNRSPTWSLALWRRADRDDLRAARPRPADGRFDPVAGLSCGAGGRAADRLRLRAGQSAGRHLLRLSRPQDPLPMTVAAQGMAPKRRRWPLAALMAAPARAGAAIVGLFLFLTAFAALIAPYDPFEQDLSAALTAPSAAHLLGTD